MKNILLLLSLYASLLYGQDKSTDRGITMEEYEKAKTLSVKDLDNDTYVKFDNRYILDRYESRKPYFITGDDGKKKRIDMYRFLLKDGLQQLGTVIFYTDEKGQRYRACLPGFKAEPAIWEKYFTDIHATDKKEPNYVLKLSYVLSKEFGFQLYKAANQGKDLSKEAGTYGSDICFPGTVSVAMANGGHKPLENISKGDRIITVDPVSNKANITEVTALVAHETRNYAITTLLLLSASELSENVIRLSTKKIQATPNHPLQLKQGVRKIGEVKEGEMLTCRNESTGRFETYTVWSKEEKAGGIQKVYNMLTTGGSTFLINDVVVSQKALQE